MLNIPLRMCAIIGDAEGHQGREIPRHQEEQGENRMAAAGLGSRAKVLTPHPIVHLTRRMRADLHSAHIRCKCAVREVFWSKRANTWVQHLLTNESANFCTLSICKCNAKLKS